MGRLPPARELQMAVSRHHIIEKKFLEAVAAMEEIPVTPTARVMSLDRDLGVEIFESQLTSRVIDLEARAMKARDEGYYTIGSAGHEGNACVAAALAPDDICFLHYRSGAFMMQRAKAFPGVSQVFDTLLSLSASAEDPASGGRHKVWGSRRMNVPPQTSTIASHLPKAVGAAFAIGRRPILDLASLVDEESSLAPLSEGMIAMASLGDASMNHSTALGAINAASWATHQRLPMPLLLVCEDNQVGISVKTPTGWIESQYASRRNLSYFRADGLDLANAYTVARSAVDFVRERRRPALLHLKMVRLMGHAGSDVELTYRTEEEIEVVESRDPLVQSARLVVRSGWMRPREILDLYDELKARAARGAAEARRRPKLVTAEEVMAPLAPFDADAVAAVASSAASPERRVRLFGGDARLPERSARPRHMAMLLNWGLHDIMAQHDEVILFGEDVAKKGGVYHVTHNLYEKFGLARVFNTLLDEQTILGVAIGAAHLGHIPCPEIQYLAYLVHAVDQIRGEAASLQFFSNMAFQNPMVVRVASLAYQRGFGGHFHNDNGFGFLREIPGLILACPSRGDDAVGMLRTAFAAAKASGRVVVFMEPIALYMTKDLHEAGDGQWSFAYPEPGRYVPVGEPRVYEAETEEALTIMTYGNGVRMSLRVARRLAADGVGVRVVDLRWLLPLSREVVLGEAARARALLVVDEGRETGGVGEEILAVVAEYGPAGLPVARVAGRDSFIPLAEAANLVLVSEEQIAEGVRRVLEKKR
ncbi:MAG TPA: MFS transporter [Planctomycetes bacterium]|nr:MFS transporter [Planctomycetota bacterium]